MRTFSRVAFSDSRVFFSMAIHSGRPSPVSIRMRLGPDPIRYVFVPACPLSALSQCQIGALRTLKRKLPWILRKNTNHSIAQLLYVFQSWPFTRHDESLSGDGQRTIRNNEPPTAGASKHVTLSYGYWIVGGSFSNMPRKTQLVVLLACEWNVG
jgi:hypothetical protein